MVFITGANGLVGSFVARRFLEAGYQVAALKRQTSDVSLVQDIAHLIQWHEGDILDVLSLEKAIQQDIDIVIHTAAVVSFIPKEREMLYKVNVEGTTNVVNACLSKGIEKVCFVSSVAALSRTPNKTEIDEEQVWQDSPLNSHYAKSKYLAELEVWRGVAEGLKAIVVCPSVILGEADWHKSSTQLFKYVFDERPFYTDGTINYVDVLDVAEAIFQLIEKQKFDERYILSAGTITYQEFLTRTADAMNKKPPRIRISAGISKILWRVEALRSLLIGSKPLITRETAQSASHSFVYLNTKVKTVLEFSFRPLNETLERIAKKFR
jgi:dihydroflavonol-4-reductase